MNSLWAIGVMFGFVIQTCMITDALAQENHVEKGVFQLELSSGQTLSASIGCATGSLLSGGYRTNPTDLGSVRIFSFPEERVNEVLWTAENTLLGSEPVAFSLELIVLCSGVGPSSPSSNGGTFYAARETHKVGETAVFNVFAIDADETTVTQLTTSPADKAYDNTAPSVSPDGTRIAFSSWRHRDEMPYGDASEIYVMNRDGSNPIRLTANRNLNDDDPKWCGNDRIIFSQGGNSIVEMDAVDLGPNGPDGNGDNPEVIVQSEENDEEFLYPSCSPDGSRIAYVRKTTSGPANEIIVANRDGSNPISLGGAQGMSTAPHWSLDGKRLLYASANPTNSIFNVYVMDAKDLDSSDGTPEPDGLGDNLQQLTFNTVDGGSYGPVWSPMGDMIVFRYTSPEGVVEPRTMNSDGSNLSDPLLPQTPETHIYDWVAD